MKRPLLIIIGTVIVLILLFVWLYVLFFNEPRTNDDTYTNLNFPNQDAIIIDQNTASDPLVNVTNQAPLRQLTTKPVIGYQEVWQGASSSPAVYYVEAGTGYIHSINLESGEEVQLSGTTISSAQKAAITPDGKFALVQSGTGHTAKFVVGSISTSTMSLDAITLNESIVDFSVTLDNTFLLAVQTTNSVIAKEYFPISQVSNTLFTVPFREAIIDWGLFSDMFHYIYPKASYQLHGYLYRADGTNITRLPATGYGLSAVGNGPVVLYSKRTDTNGPYQSYRIIDITTDEKLASLVVLPEKCAAAYNSSSVFVCASTGLTFDRETPDSWYQGRQTYQDNLWEINMGQNTATQLINITNQSGRYIDVVDLQANSTDTRLYFTNRTDKTLWIYTWQPLYRLLDEFNQQL